ncbi:hypothetical protein FGD67_06385 [Colwellia sp. M166]|uniref:hypothetical protein n=1 Tax=Colwellia sp. M166 TaxID=2583805 RepID=UPI00211EE546|nr:hypothetical protein [Colwellia sp. M166]UUO22857.1 hypothetical protein FGD67_06385 [Colwellia sp. M166]
MQVLNNQHNTTGQAAPAHIVALAKKVNHLNRLQFLRKHGFTEQNNIAQYQQKLADNRNARLFRQAKTLARKMRALNKQIDRALGLA